MERLPPYNAEAEEAVLGCLLIGQGDMLPEVEPILQPSDFFREKGGWVYQAVLNLNKRESAIDFVTICDELERMGKLDKVGGPAYVMSLINAVPTSLHAEHYAKIVYEHSVRRQLIQVAQDIVTLAYGDGTEGVESLLAKAEQKLAKVGQRIRPKVYTVEDVLSGFWDELFHPTGKTTKRIFTGLAGIDGPLLGIESSRFWAMAAVPGSGKTAYALNIVRGAVKNNKGEIAVLYFHPEQPREEITQLLWCSGTESLPPIRLKAMMTPKEERQNYLKAEAFINGSTQTREIGKGQAKTEYLMADPKPEEVEALTQSQAEIDGVPIILEDPSGQNIHRILATIRRVRYKLPNHVFLLVVFDGAHLIPGMGEGKRLEELYTITRNLKIAAQKLVTADGEAAGAIIANTQLNREIFSNVANRVYQMKHLRDSGSWEQDSDVILFIDRDSVFTNGTSQLWDPFKTIAAKNRQTSKLFTAYYVMNTSTMMVKGRDLT